MFENLNYTKSLDEECFESWLEKGRSSNHGYHYLLVVWNMYDEDFQPLYLTNRDKISEFMAINSTQEILIAAYDLYSESRITL